MTRIIVVDDEYSDNEVGDKAAKKVLRHYLDMLLAAGFQIGPVNPSEFSTCAVSDDPGVPEEKCIVVYDGEQSGLRIYERGDDNKCCVFFNVDGFLEYLAYLVTDNKEWKQIEGIILDLDMPPSRHFNGPDGVVDDRNYAGLFVLDIIEQTMRENDRKGMAIKILSNYNGLEIERNFLANCDRNLDSFGNMECEIVRMHFRKQGNVNDFVDSFKAMIDLCRKQRNQN